MNVSSVKNLNGEAFSAVQDAALTDVVQTNSGTWGGGSIPSTVSGKWEDASDCVQTNSGAWGQGGGGSDLSAYTNSSFYIKNLGSYTTYISANTDGYTPNLVLRGNLAPTLTGMSPAPATITLNDEFFTDEHIRDFKSTKDIVWVNSGKWNDTAQVVQTNSAQWSQGGGSDTNENVLFRINRLWREFRLRP